MSQDPLATLRQEPAPFLAMVHALHDARGFISRRDTEAIARALGMPVADVFAALSFYYYLNREERPISLLGACDGPACRLAGARDLRERLRRQHGIGPDDRSPDGGRRFLDFPCAGLCDAAPAWLADGRFRGENGRERGVPWETPGEKAVFRFGDADLRSLAAYRSAGGYRALERARSQGDPQGLIRALEESGLAGRGGAGFPLGRKLRMVRAASGEGKYLVCNADEGEPGTFKDRDILERLPHLLLEGMAIAAFAAGAEVGIIYLRFEYPEGAAALRVANHKVNLGFGEALALGILCNALVALAIWLAIGARGTIDKIAAIVFPITAFVAAGFEHSIANMYFIPAGLLMKEEAAVREAAGLSSAALSNLTWDSFFLENLLPVTIGNIIGGALLVGAVYWFVYLRPRPAAADPQPD